MVEKVNKKTERNHELWCNAHRNRFYCCLLWPLLWIWCVKWATQKMKQPFGHMPSGRWIPVLEVCNWLQYRVRGPQSHKRTNDDILCMHVPSLYLIINEDIGIYDLHYECESYYKQMQLLKRNRRRRPKITIYYMHGCLM